MQHASIARVICASGSLFAGVVACKANSDASFGAYTTRVDGSSTVFPISKEIADEFGLAHSARVQVEISGTAGGFRKFCAGATDISNASRPINQTEAEQCRQSGVSYVELPVGYDGLAVVVHPKNSWAKEITTSELKKLWAVEAQGKVTRWNQVRESWPDQELHLYGPGVDSGTYDYFTEAILQQEHSSRTDYTASEDDRVLVQGVASDELALGFFGYVYYHDNRARLKVLAVDDGRPENGDGPILPSVATVRAGTYQPLSRPLFLYVSTAALERPVVDAFVRFYLTRARRVSDEHGYVPLPDSAYELARQRLLAKRTGSVFGSRGSQVGVAIEALLAKEQRELESD